MDIDVIVFDMDGVLVDVTESYRQSIADTVLHFTGKPVTPESIQDFKNSGGWNNDWALSHRIIEDAGVTASYETVAEYFQSIFFVDEKAGLILRERWLAAGGLLERLGERYQLSVFTGRPRHEAEFTLSRFAPSLKFSPIITMNDLTRHKPLPDGLLLAGELTGGKRLCYVGDTVDDARCARAAGVPFIGVAAPTNPRDTELRELFRGEGAVGIVDDINQLPQVLAS